MLRLPRTKFPFEARNFFHRKSRGRAECTVMRRLMFCAPICLTEALSVRFTAHSWSVLKMSSFSHVVFLHNLRSKSIKWFIISTKHHRKICREEKKTLLERGKETKEWPFLWMPLSRHLSGGGALPVAGESTHLWDGWRGSSLCPKALCAPFPC